MLKTTRYFQTLRREEGANQATQRVKSGYYDKKTGRYYTKQEYNTMRKYRKPGV